MKAIVAVDENWGIGKDGGLLCHLSADLKYFKAVTMGHPVILGRKTLSTFPGGRALPGRVNRILSTTLTTPPEGAEVYTSLEALRQADNADAFLIGGAQVYREMLADCDEVYVTRIRRKFDADAFFPDLDASDEWVLAESGEEQEENGIRFVFTRYERR